MFKLIQFLTYALVFAFIWDVALWSFEILCNLFLDVSIKKTAESSKEKSLKVFKDIIIVVIFIS